MPQRGAQEQSSYSTLHALLKRGVGGHGSRLQQSMKCGVGGHSGMLRARGK